MGSTETYILHIQVILKCCYIPMESSRWENWNNLSTRQISYRGFLKMKMLAGPFNPTFNYIDVVLPESNPKFSDYVDRSYPTELAIKDTTDTSRSLSLLYPHREIDRVSINNETLLQERLSWTFHWYVATYFHFLETPVWSLPGTNKGTSRWEEEHSLYSYRDADEQIKYTRTFHWYVATFQHYLYMEYLCLSWSHIPVLLVPIITSLVDGYC
jgi:hypothetical protein